MRIWQRRFTSLRRSVAPYVLLLTLFQKKRLKVMVKPFTCASTLHLFWVLFQLLQAIRSFLWTRFNPVMTFFNITLFLKHSMLACIYVYLVLYIKKENFYSQYYKSWKKGEYSSINSFVCKPSKNSYLC